jgi:hypothetical protein
LNIAVPLPATAKLANFYFFSSRPIERAIRLTDPAYLPSSAAIFDARSPRLAILDSFCISEAVHSLG